MFHVWWGTTSSSPRCQTAPQPEIRWGMVWTWRTLSSLVHSVDFNPLEFYLWVHPIFGLSKCLSVTYTHYTNVYSMNVGKFDCNQERLKLSAIKNRELCLHAWEWHRLSVVDFRGASPYLRRHWHLDVSWPGSFPSFNVVLRRLKTCNLFSTRYSITNLFI